MISRCDFHASDTCFVCQACFWILFYSLFLFHKLLLLFWYININFLKLKPIVSPIYDSHFSYCQYFQKFGIQSWIYVIVYFCHKTLHFFVDFTYNFFIAGLTVSVRNIFKQMKNSLKTDRKPDILISNQQGYILNFKF